MLRSLRTNPCEERPAKTGRTDGRQAPIMPRDDSTIGQLQTGGKDVYGKNQLSSAAAGEHEWLTGDVLVARADLFSGKSSA